jgi:Thrombospondin type 3 repeat
VKGRTSRTLAPLIVALLALAVWPASVFAFGDTFQSPELLNQAGTPLNTSYTRTDNNVGATGGQYTCRSEPYDFDVWYQIHPQSNGLVGIAASSNDFAPVVAFWAFDPQTGQPGPLPQGIAPCATAQVGSTTAAVNNIPVEAGKTYDIQVGIDCLADSCSFTETGGDYAFALSYSPDTDGDGVLDVVDGCKTVPGPASNGGCPPDADHDGVPDASDRCPNNPGTPSTGGCPLLPTLIGQNFATVTKIRQIYVSDVPPNSTIVIKCKGRHCFRGRTVFVSSAKRKVVLVSKKTVARGDVITTQVTAPGTIGRFRQIKIPRRSNRLAVSDLLCVQPGAKSATQCPS